MIKLEIFNDGSGTEKLGNYECYLYLPENGRYVEHNARLLGFDRSLGWRALVEQAVALLAQ